MLAPFSLNGGADLATAATELAWHFYKTLYDRESTVKGLGHVAFLGYSYCSADAGDASDDESDGEGEGDGGAGSARGMSTSGLWGTWEIVGGQVKQELRDGGVFRLVPLDG